MDNGRRLKRGEILFKEGENTDIVWVVQSGRISLFVERSGKKIEIDQVAAGQILGVQSVFGRLRRSYGAEAANETRVMEVPAHVIRTQYEAAPAGIKLLLKGLGDGHRLAREQIKAFRLETDGSPCPQLYIPKLFAILTLVCDHAGEKKEDGTIKISWTPLKIYTSRMFLESHMRMQSCLELLTKLKYARMHFEKNEEGEEELNAVELLNPRIVEDFAEFYQYNLYKGGRAEIIYVDEMALKVAKALLHCSVGVEPDRKGIMALENEKTMAEIKEKFRFELKATHFDILEKKGLFVKRQTRDQGVYLSFDHQEFSKTVSFWEIIREIDKWNIKGHVDMNEKEVVAAEPVGEAGECPECKTQFAATAKFCANCGFKLAA